MAHRNKVTRSIEAPGGQACVDLWRAPDGTHGWTAYRRDPEALTGWFPTGLSAAGFADPTAALADARAALPWLGVAD